MVKFTMVSITIFKSQLLLLLLVSLIISPLRSTIQKAGSINQSYQQSPGLTPGPFLIPISAELYGMAADSVQTLTSAQTLIPALV